MFGIPSMIWKVLCNLLSHDLFMKQGSLFCFVYHGQISQTTTLHVVLLVFSKSGALTWFETIRSYNAKYIDYWTIFSMKIEKNWNWNLYYNFGAFLVILESHWKLRFNRVYFTIFKAKVWKILSFEFCCWKFKQIGKIGFGRKNQLSPQHVHCAKFRNFQLWKCEK